MAIIGYNGSVKVGINTMGNAKIWSLDITKDTVDTTTFGSDGWKQTAPLFRGWTGSITAIFDASGVAEGALQASLLGDSTIALELQMGDGSGTFDTYTGDAHILSQNVTNDINGIVEAVFNFEGNGALVIS